jgi:hypothetical protein
MSVEEPRKFMRPKTWGFQGLAGGVPGSRQARLRGCLRGVDARQGSHMHLFVRDCSARFVRRDIRHRSF